MNRSVKKKRHALTKKKWKIFFFKVEDNFQWWCMFCCCFRCLLRADDCSKLILPILFWTSRISLRCMTWFSRGLTWVRFFWTIRRSQRRLLLTIVLKYSIVLSRFTLMIWFSGVRTVYGRAFNCPSLFDCLNLNARVCQGPRVW